MKNKVGYVVYCLLVVIPLLEGLLWLGGYRPYAYKNFSIVSYPGQNISADATLGLRLNPGSYRVTINQGLTYITTHNANGFRQAIIAKADSIKGKIAFFGCSYTYGMGVNNDEHLSALIDKQMNAVKITNYAVPGYGTIQGYLQLKQLIVKGKKPDVAIFNFADFHLERNSLTPAYRLHLSIGYEQAQSNESVKMGVGRFPFVIQGKKELVIKSERWKDLYKHWKGRNTFALINLLQTISDRYATTAINKERNTIELFKQISNLCLKNKIRLIVTGITESSETQVVLKALEEEEIEVLDISLPLELPEYNHLPFDSHPNKKAHQIYAERIKKYLAITSNSTME